MKHPHIPRTWTGPEALAIVEAFEAAVDVYRAEIRVESLAREMERDALIAGPAPPPVQPADLAPL